MYLKKIVIENYGPFDLLDYAFKFNKDNSPRPLILIGKNGSGKTLFLSHIVNSMIAAKQNIYNDCEVEKGKVYKYRSPNYIKTGKKYFYSKVEYTDNSKITEWQLNDTRKNIEETEGFTKPNEDWENIQVDDASSFTSTFSKPASKNFIEQNCALYFPSNRFEEPAWLNQDNIINPLEYQELKRVSGYSNRTIISLSSLKSCQKWLLDVILDRCTYELKTSTLPVQVDGKTNVNFNLFLGYTGHSSLIFDEINRLINLLFNASGNLRLGVGNRKNRHLSIVREDEPFVPDLFQLSSGESLLLGLFLNIIRDFDLCVAQFNSFVDIKGIVLIDEIDLHLHGNLQKDILPEVIKLFPNIQFVITTHSPLFLLGMEKLFGDDGYDILELPRGDNINIENFSEFTDVFIAISETKAYEEQLKEKIEETQLPVVFVEGDYDIRYLKKTIEFHYSVDLLNQFTFVDGEGFGNLDKVWNSLKNPVTKSLPSKAFLLYDCDIKEKDSTYENISRKTIPINDDNPIKIGIENLLSAYTINKLEEENECYIDFISAHEESIRGVITSIPEQKAINKDEKGNICNWLCDHGEADDFTGFKTAIDMIIEFLESCNNQPAD